MGRSEKSGGCRLVPAVVLDLHHVPRDAGRKSPDRFKGRGAKGCAVLDAKTGAVAGAGNLIALKLGDTQLACQSGAVVAADVFHGVIAPANVKNGDVIAAGIDHLEVPG